MESNRHSIKTVIKNKRRHHHHHHHHRRTKKISKKIELKKPNFQCVINLNTTICKHEAQWSKLNTTTCECQSHRSNRESDRMSSLVQEPLTLRPQCYSRIAPYCFREKCRCSIKQYQCQKFRKLQDRAEDKMANQYRHNIRRQHRLDIRRARRLRNKCCKHKNDSLHLSPISSSPLKDDLNHLYEDISNDSLDEVLETPMSYKNVRYVENKVESKLDTLIKRTKERERKLVAQSRSQPSYSFSSTSNISSGECPMDLASMDTASLHSRTTLILEQSQSNFIYLSSDTDSLEYSPRSPLSDFNLYNSGKFGHGHMYSSESPSKNDFIMNGPKKYEDNQTYSPGSPLQRDLIMNIPTKYEPDFKIDDIKPEPIDIRTYSPTFDYSKEKIKQEVEIKTESFENVIEFDIKKEVE